MDKDSLRAKILSKCSESGFTKLHIQEVINKIVFLDEFKDAECILVYAPDGNTEIPFVFELMKQVQNKKYFFPKVVGNWLEFYLIQDRNEMSTGKFGILEPQLELCTQKRRFSKCDKRYLIFVPAVAVDSQGNRLGRGGGFYDRFLGGILSETQGMNKKVFIVSVMPTCTVVDKVPAEPHDIQLNKIIFI